LSAKDLKYDFGRLLGFARAEPIAVAEHGRPFGIVLTIEEHERLKMLELKAMEHTGATDVTPGKTESG
jgi:hypothetical protein